MSINKQSIYKDVLMQHFRHPHNKQVGSFDETYIVARGRNPKCGDDIEVGIKFDSFDELTEIKQAGFRGRGCSVCLASASMMVKLIEGMNAKQAFTLADTMQAWVENTVDLDQKIPSELQALEAVKHHPARKKCVMLAWNALQAINQQQR